MKGVTVIGEFASPQEVVSHLVTIVGDSGTVSLSDDQTHIVVTRGILVEHIRLHRCQVQGGWTDRPPMRPGFYDVLGSPAR